MLFNSAEFLFLFAPIVIFVYISIRLWHFEASIWWLVGASLVFYAAWDAAFLPVILFSIFGNYLIFNVLQRAKRWRRAWLIVGVTGNLALLGYFKYTNFLLDNLNAALDLNISWVEVVLPIGISFFTFQQIAFLVDVYRGETVEKSFSRYALFISFFPQLIAGPIVHHREMMPQFGRARDDRWGDVAEGLTLLTIGLVKKMVIADTVAVPSSAVFDAAAQGATITLVDAWVGAVAYSLQIYFDFSAYSDMAIGLGRMMGINLPINFASPYKADSITEFWRRWHITLSRFLRDYLYIPLGGNRQGPIRQKTNLMLTMLLGGVWHGAGWTFLLWGFLHGFYLLVHQTWRATALGAACGRHPAWRPVAHALTLFALVVAWVPFRAADLASTVAVWRGMLGFNGVGPLRGLAFSTAIGNQTLALALVVATLIALFAPNAYQLLASARIGLPSPGYPATRITERWSIAPHLWSQYHAAAIGVGLMVVVLKLNDISEFIYFQF